MAGDIIEVQFEATANTGLNVFERTTSKTERTHLCNILERYGNHLYLTSPKLFQELTPSTLPIKLGRKMSALNELDLIAYRRGPLWWSV
jgi:hypothetical protein